MPDRRALVVALGLAVGIGLYLNFSLGWPTFVVVGVAALIGLVVLLIAASITEDAAAADAAWRAAAPDLARRHLGPGSDREPDG